MRKDERQSRKEIAEAVRRACLRTALEHYDDALMRGLCREGAWDCAVDAMKSLDLDAVLIDGLMSGVRPDAEDSPA